jgi:hypothetical protein
VTDGIFKLNVMIDDKIVSGSLDEKIRTAATKATKQTAFDIKDAIRHEMQRVFDRPTPFTLNSMVVIQDKGAVNASVIFKEGELYQKQHYLRPHIDGGTRAQKRTEYLLGSRASALPPGWVTVPGSAARLDRYGNMSRGQLMQITSYVRANYDVGVTSNRPYGRHSRGQNAKPKYHYFAVRKGIYPHHLRPGIWQRHPYPLSPTPALIFVPRATYRPVLHVRRIAYEVVKDKMPGYLHTALGSSG